jgi:hypothetical protein
MIITTTAISFILLSIGLGICSWWFLRAINRSGDSKKNNTIDWLLGTFIFLSALQNGVLGFGLLLFAASQTVLLYVLIVTDILLVAHATLGTYIIPYIFFPKTPLHFAPFFTGILGFYLVLLTVVSSPEGVVTAWNTIHWGMNYMISLLTFLLLFISIGSFIFIFSQLFLKGKTPEVKKLSLFLSICGLFGLANVFFRFIIFYSESSGRNLFLLDVSMGVIGTAFIFLLLLSIAWKLFLHSRSH